MDKAGSRIVGFSLFVSQWGRLTVMFCSLLLMVAMPARGADERPPNILLLVSDDHQHSALGAAGNPIVQTPHLDRLASQGVRFTHAFVHIPICTPSRAAYLTGMYGPHNGVTFFGKKRSQGVVSLAEILSKRGYQTAFTGKWHNDQRPPAWGFGWTANVFAGGMGPYTDPKLVQGADDPPRVTKGNITELIADAAVRFLGERDASRPFFLNVAFTAPHDPRTPPPEYERMYEPERMALPGNFMASPRFDPGTLNIRDEKLLPLPREAAAVRREIGRYYGLITHLDAQIGRILDALEKHKLADDTIVIFVGDNGLALGAHGLLGKQTMYDEGVRVPLIVRHPRLEGRRGETRDALVDLIDLLPTICDWTGTPPPPSVDGRSFAGLLKGETPRVRDAIFGTYDEKDTPLFRMIRTERYKLICYLQLNREELFDLQADPLELKDLSDDPGLQEVRDRLRARLKELRKSAGEKVDEPAAK